MRYCSDTLRGWFGGILKRYDRVVVVGPSGCGKSTLANEVQVDDRPVLRSDDFKKYTWEDVPQEIIKAATDAGTKWVAEGVMLARALRKGLQCDAVVYLELPRRPQLKGQVIQGKGIKTVFDEWRRANGNRIPVWKPPREERDEE